MNTHETFTREEVVQGSSNLAFGLVFAAIFALVGLVPLWRGHPVRWWALSVGTAFLAAVWLRPEALGPLNRVWTSFSRLLNRVTNPIVLGVLFYVVFTPFGLAMRLFRPDPLRLKFDAQAPSYWLPRRPPGPPPDSMASQF